MKKKDFLCCAHSKKHIPKKRIKDKTTSNNSVVIEIDEKIKNKDDKINKNIYKNNRINKIYLYNRKKHIKNKTKSLSPLPSLFNDIGILYNNIICNSFNLFTNKCKNIDKHGFCDFKHINNNINIIDFIK